MIKILAKFTKEGKLKVGEFFKEDLKKLYGKDVEVGSFEETRNSQQNRYLWGVVYKTISLDTGFTVEEVHEIFKNKFLSYKKLHNEKWYMFTRSTTELSVSEFADYINKVKDFSASELGIYIPDADKDETNENN